MRCVMNDAEGIDQIVSFQRQDLIQFLRAAEVELTRQPKDLEPLLREL